MFRHGLFNTPSRLTAHAHSTDESCGYTMWHMLAAGILDPDVAEWFLEETLQAPTNVLIDDLREAMTVFPPLLQKGWIDNADYRLLPNGSSLWGWKRFRTESAWQTPLGICEMIGRPLIRLDIPLTAAHPVVWAAHGMTLRKMEVNRRW